MIFTGVEYLEELIEGAVFDVKLVFNERGAIVLPSRRQHREMKSEGISYEDNYAGNALAAMLRLDALEIRYHRSFGDAAVAAIVRELFADPSFGPFRAVRVSYQGRPLSI